MNPRKTATMLLVASVIVFAISDYYVNNPGTAIQKNMYQTMALLETATGITQFLNLFHYTARLSFFISWALGAFLILAEICKEAKMALAETSKEAKKEIEKTKQGANRDEILIAILVLVSPLIFLSSVHFMMFQRQIIFFFIGTIIFMAIKTKACENWLMNRMLQTGGLLLIGTLLKLPAIALAGGYVYAGLLQKAYQYSISIEKVK